jgi:hypothetical protein
MGEFEDRLWRELEQRHGSDLAGLPAHTGPRRVPRPRLLAGTSLGLAGTGAALALVLSAGSAAPAFAVTRNHDGTVNVVIRRADAIAAANARLSALGIHAQAVQVTSACGTAIVSKQVIPSGNVAVKQVPIAAQARKALISARINPGKIPAGRTLVIAAGPAGGPQREIGTVVSQVRPLCLNATSVGVRVAALAQARMTVLCHAGHVRVLIPSPALLHARLRALRAARAAGHVLTPVPAAVAAASGTTGTATGSTTTSTGTATTGTTTGPTTTSTGTATTGVAAPATASGPVLAPAPLALRRLQCPPMTVVAPAPTGTTFTSTTGTSTTDTTTASGSATTTSAGPVTAPAAKTSAPQQRVAKKAAAQKR